jgi:uncharacterized repeat protein (TIGR01451 family)
MDTRVSTGTRLSLLPVLIALLMNLLVGPLAPMVQTVLAADPVITQDPSPNGCNGVLPTPGSENTNKRYIGGSLEPGGTATFEISFPVDASDVGGDFRITDCVFIEGVAVAKYFIDFVPNNENFLLTFTLNIPSNAPVGDEFCNYAKTTASPSNSQASNRKAGPACFLIGGALRVTKVDGSGNPLAGAVFSVSCQWPTSTSALAATVVAAEPNGSVTDGNDAGTTAGPSETFTSTSGGTLNVSATTGTAGTVAVQAPIGTSCTFTETAAPAGYILPADPDCTIAVILGQQGTCNFVNLQTGKLEVVKDLDPSSDPGKFNLQIDGATAGTGANVGDGGTTGEQTLTSGNHTVGETAGTATSLGDYGSAIVCKADNGAGATVASGTNAGPLTVNVTGGSDIVCTITNNRLPGKLEVVKDLDPSSDPGKFNLQIDGATAGTGANVGDGGTTGEVSATAGNHTVGETAGTGTALADYASSIVCKADNGAGATVASGSGSGPLTVPVASNSDIVCTITNTRDTGTLEVVKDLSPDTDPGRFDLLINGSVEADDAGDGDTTGPQTLNTGTHTVGEAAGTGTSLANYTSSISCRDENGAGDIVASGSGVGPLNVTLGDNDDIVCVITNTRQTGGLEVVKDLVPANDPGKFNLQIDSATLAANVGDAGTTGQQSVNTGVHTVGETAGTSTTLANYSSSIECRANNGTGDIVAQGSGAGPLNVTVTNGADIVCVISNTRVTVGFDKANDLGDNATVEPGETIHYELVVTVNDGMATGVVVTDELPDGLTYVTGSANPSAGFSIAGQDLTWNVGTLAEGVYKFQYDATVDADASGALTNLGCVDADQNDELVCDETTVLVQNIVVTKTNGTTGSVVPGTVVDFTLTLDVINGPIDNVTIVDQLPTGITNATNISDGGIYSAATNRITWTLTNVADNEVLTYKATVTAAAAGAQTNVATITEGPCVGDGCDDDSTVTVRIPTLVIDKVASAETITISGPNNALIATPSVVTWTLSYTLTSGPVTGAVITDQVPTGFTFLDAANGGTFAAGTVTWNLGTVTTSGSVSFRTTVNPATISRTAPTVNTAIIDSNETAPDSGQDSVTVTVVPPPLGGTPTPPLPNTALAFGANGQAVSVPVELLVAFFIGSLGALALANVRASSRRR